jgi:hypothetical protein
MLQEIEEMGGLHDQYEDTRRRPDFEVTVSTELAPDERAAQLEGVTACSKTDPSKSGS